MKRFAVGHGLAAAAMVLSVAVVAQSQDEGVKQVEQLTKKAGATVQAIANTKVQLMKTMDVYNGLMAEGTTDRKDAYKKLQQEMATTEKRRSEIALRADEMKAEADALFKSWTASTAAISDADLRKRSEERLAKTKANFGEVGTVGQKATELYGPVMKALQDQVTYLGHDLNPSAVASLKPNAAKLNDQAKELTKRIDDTITTSLADRPELRHGHLHGRPSTPFALGRYDLGRRGVHRVPWCAGASLGSLPEHVPRRPGRGRRVVPPARVPPARRSRGGAGSVRRHVARVTEGLMRRHRLGRARLLLAAAFFAAPAAAPSDGTPQAVASGTPQTRTVVAGKEFDRSGKWRSWFGEGYRKAWTTPIDVPVLDLKTEAGGLTPLRQVGGLQTVGLAMKGANGRGYTFRKLEKHPERVLPKEWQDSELRQIAQDQTAAAHPAATVIIGHLAQAVGIHFYGSRLAIMPDDPALGKFRETFANSIGTFDEYPTPGYKGVTEIVSSLDMWKKWREGGPESRVDSRAFLRARLFDLVVGNWDRHQGQWRWARVEGNPLWEPFPEDADQAFSRYEGKAMSAVRTVVPRFMRYSGEYPKRMEGLTANNYDVTRWILADLEWPVYEEVARELVARMTDAVIDEAMHQMPPQWYAIDGAQMTKDLRSRRDGIVEYARRFYLHLADRVDVRASDRDERADVRHFEDGSLELTLAPPNPDGTAGAPYYRRRFSPKETEEIHLYLLGGNDRLVTSGPREGEIDLHVLGDAGNDTLDDSGSGGARIRDGRGRNTLLRGPGTKVNESEWRNPAPEKDRPWLEPRGYGHWTVPMIQVYWQPNQEFMLGGGFTRTAWGFRKYPWANMQSFTLLYATGYQNVRASYLGEWRLSSVKLVGTLKARFSGIENLNFFGFGNETPKIEDKALYKTETNEYMVFPALSYRPSFTFEMHVGAEAKVVETKGGDSLVEQQQVYGSGTFGEAGLRAGFEFDSRGRSIGMTAMRGIAVPDASAAVAPPKVNGVRILAEGFFVPKAWDVEQNFGGVEGSVASYLGSQKLVLATRVGGRTVWGTYPWFESASITGILGGVRGYYDGRFRGDSSFYGNAELRWWIGRRKGAVLPLRWGLTAFGESGRVWYEDESSKRWHTGYGGGVMVQLIGTPMALGASIANGTEGIRFYFSGGYSF